MRRLGAIAGGTMLAAGLVLAAPGLSGALIHPYPPPPPISGQGSVTVGVGHTGSFTVCGYRPGATVVVNVGPGSSTAVADSHGCVTISVKVTAGPKASINGGPTISRPCGASAITLYGPTPPPTTSLNWTETLHITGCSSR